jgi:hypothetical protein
MAQSPVELQPMDSAATNANLRSFKSNASLKARWRKSNYRGNLSTSLHAQKVDTLPDVANEEDVLLLSETGLHQEEQNGDFDGGWKASPTSNAAAASSCAQLHNAAPSDTRNRLLKEASFNASSSIRAAPINLAPFHLTQQVPLFLLQNFPLC